MDNIAIIDKENRRDMIIPFGRYKGLQVSEIYFEDKSYLKWLKDNCGPSRPELKTVIEEYFR